MLFVITALENAAVCEVVMPVSPTGSTAPRNCPGTSADRRAGVAQRPGDRERRGHEQQRDARSAARSGRSRTRTQYVRPKNVRSEPRRGSSA